MLIYRLHRKLKVRLGDHQLTVMKDIGIVGILNGVCKQLPIDIFFHQKQHGSLAVAFADTQGHQKSHDTDLRTIHECSFHPLGR